MSPAELWIVAATIIFAVLAWRPGKRGLLGSLDARRHAIESKLDEASRLAAEAEALLIDAEMRHEAAGRDAEDILAFAADEAKRLREKAEADLQMRISNREKQATDRIAQAEAEAITEIRNKAVDLALAATATLLTQKFEIAGDPSIDAIVQSLPQTLRAADRR